LNYKDLSLIKKGPPDKESLRDFLSKVNFKLPEGYVEFISKSNGAEGSLAITNYLALWSVEELFELNSGYHVDEFAPGFFIIGSHGGGEAYAVDKETGELYEMPFEVMSRDEAIWRASDFSGFITYLENT
jgi:hypothetical protein